MSASRDLFPRASVVKTTWKWFSDSSNAGRGTVVDDTDDRDDDRRLGRFLVAAGRPPAPTAADRGNPRKPPLPRLEPQPPPAPARRKTPTTSSRRREGPAIQTRGASAPSGGGDGGSSGGSAGGAGAKYKRRGHKRSRRKDRRSDTDEDDDDDEEDEEEGSPGEGEDPAAKGDGPTVEGRASTRAAVTGGDEDKSATATAHAHAHWPQQDDASLYPRHPYHPNRSCGHMGDASSLPRPLRNFSLPRSVGASTSSSRRHSEASSSGRSSIFGTVHRWYESILHSRAVRLAIELAEDQRAQASVDTCTQKMLVTAVYFVLLMGSILATVFALFEHELPGIHFYNLIHIVLHIVGKNILVAGVLLASLSARALVAKSLVRSVGGVKISEIALRDWGTGPPPGRKLRLSFYASLVLVEVALWVLELEMEFVPVGLSPLGTFPCTPSSYPKAVEPKEGMMVYLQGNSRLPMVYSYGLPLLDGVVGGWSAWPKSRPAQKFAIEDQGVAYLVGAKCSNPVPVSGPLPHIPPNTTFLSDDQQQQAPVTTFQLLEIKNRNASFTFSLAVNIPQFAHDRADYIDREIQLVCRGEVTTGPAIVRTSFSADEWKGVGGGSTISIKLPDPFRALRANASMNEDSEDLPQFDEDPMELTQGMGGEPKWYDDGGCGSACRFVAQVRDRLAPVAEPYMNLTQWIGKTIHHLFTVDGSAHALATEFSKSSQADDPPLLGPNPVQIADPVPADPVRVRCGHATSSSSTCDLLQWTTNAAGVVDTSMMHRGVIVLTAAVAHYVVMQYDESVTGTCAYFGDRGRGVVEAAFFARIFVAVSVVVCLFLASALVLTFLLAMSGSPRHVRLAVAALEDPLRMLYYMRNSLPNLVQRGLALGSDRGRLSLRWLLEDVNVRFGESKKDRGEDVGTLALDVPWNVIRLRKDRKYE
ncbi:hypothetical protein DFJ73DRAFT_966168 [Zopfochytrium polystomum]|nr:hypothetical protein DFJ73DRAFT_966168 [Zopfochytrium polystomum]